MARLDDRTVGITVHAAALFLALAGSKAHAALTRRGSRAARAVIPVVLVSAWASIDALERCRPFRTDWRTAPDERAADFAMTLLGRAPMAVATPAGLSVARRVPLRLGLGRLPSVIAVPAGIVAFDLCDYWTHRLLHRWGPLWRLHAVHHAPQRLQWHKAPRFHPLEMLLAGTVGTAADEVIGLTSSQQVTTTLIRGMYSRLQHSNVALDSGALSRVLSTPDLHRWHHSATREESDANYGAVFSVWDRIFGSWQLPRPFDREVGIDGSAT